MTDKKKRAKRDAKLASQSIDLNKLNKKLAAMAEARAPMNAECEKCGLRYCDCENKY